MDFFHLCHFFNCYSHFTSKLSAVLNFGTNEFLNQIDYVDHSKVQNAITLLTFTYEKSATKTLENDVKHLEI